MILGAVVRTLVQSVLRAIALSFALFVGLNVASIEKIRGRKLLLVPRNDEL